MTQTAMTRGTHHIGLTVANIRESARFFTGLLGWTEVGGDPDYPAIFVSDGRLMITLWALKAEVSRGFDKNANVGLHHLALQVESDERLDEIYRKLNAAGTVIEFSPQALREGPARHMMCYEPGGIRVEFIHIPE